MEIKIKKLREGAVLPKRATEGSVGYDLCAAEDAFIGGMGRTVVPTGIAIELPEGYEAQIRPRSGNSSKGIPGYSAQYGNRRFSADVLLGTVDADYRGEIGIIVKNHDFSFMIEKGTRLAQMVINKVETPALVEVDELSDTTRGEGGFGSTGR